MPTTAPPLHANPAGTRLAWRPLQRSTRVAIVGALLAALSYQLFLLDPAYRGPWWLWTATILAHDDRPEPVEVTIWRNQLRDGAASPGIDVFITAYGEPPELLLATMRAARDMELPHRTWVLDDGRSDVLARICAREGVGYLRRDGREDAKAGNVNAALARTDGEYVVVFDADHVPEPSFLLELLPHFQDEGVAFVQSPQHYVNRVNIISAGTAEAQRIFYELVCPGKNRFNAAFCVGTNVMFRRSALDDIGGLATGTNSEDIWTSVHLHQRGWKSIYVPYVLAKGLAPEDVGTYLKQQLRWASGGFEVLLRGRLFRRGNGLTLDQRLQYLFVGTHYLLSMAMLTFMFLPATYLLFGFSPIQADGWTWARHYVPFYAMVLLVTWLQSGGFRLSAIVTSIGSAPVHARALWATLRRKPATWSVTHRAGDGVLSLRPVLPHLALLVLNLTGIAVGLTVMADPPPTWLSAAWASMHVLLLGRVTAEPFTRRRAARDAGETTPPTPIEGDATMTSVTTQHDGAGPAEAPPAVPVPRSDRPRRPRLAAVRTFLVVLVLLAVAGVGGTSIALERLHARAFVALGGAVLTAEEVRVGAPELAVVTDIQVAEQRRVTAGQPLATVKPTFGVLGAAPEPQVLRAPMDGTVLSVKAVVGGVAVPGEPVVTLYDQSRLTFQAEVPAKRLRGLRIGMRAALDSPVLDHGIGATLDHVVPRVGADARNGADRLIVVLVPDPAALGTVEGLVPGLPFDVTVDTRTAAGTAPAVRSAG